MHWLRLLVRDLCPLKEAGPVRIRPAMYLYITHALYFEIYTTLIQLMSIAGHEAYVCVCFYLYKTVCAAFIWLPWDARSRGGYRGGGAMGALAPPSRKWAGLQCAHAQRHVITIGLYTLNRCFWRVFRAATDQGRI